MNSYDHSQSEPGNEQPSYSPPPQICQNIGPAITENDFMASPPPPSHEYRAEVPSNSHNLALPRSDAIETPFGVITPENLIWDPPNLQELGPLKLVGVYNLPPPFWPANLKDKVKNFDINVDKTNRADDSSNMKNPSSSVPHNMFEELLENLDFSTPSRANDDIFEILELSVDAYNEQTEIDAVIEQEEDKDKLPLSPHTITSHNMEAAAFDSEERLSYVTGSKKRKWDIFFDDDSSSGADDESSSMSDDWELFELPHANAYAEDFFTTLYSPVFSDESTVAYD